MPAVNNPGVPRSSEKVSRRSRHNNKKLLQHESGEHSLYPPSLCEVLLRQGHTGSEGRKKEDA